MGALRLRSDVWTNRQTDMHKMAVIKTDRITDKQKLGMHIKCLHTQIHTYQHAHTHTQKHTYTNKHKFTPTIMKT